MAIGVEPKQSANEQIHCEYDFAQTTFVHTSYRKNVKNYRNNLLTRMLSL